MRLRYNTIMYCLGFSIFLALSPVSWQKQYRVSFKSKIYLKLIDRKLSANVASKGWPAGFEPELNKRKKISKATGIQKK
jgi:hypothetical protein